MKNEELKRLSDYPPSWGLTDHELEGLLEKCKEGLKTTNGDTAPVEVTVRQLLLLLRTQME
jgi:hypothetical protein